MLHRNPADITADVTPSGRIREPQVRARLSAPPPSRTTFWRLRRDDDTFPRPYEITPGVRVWDADAVDAWLARKRDSAAHPVGRRPEAALAARRMKIEGRGRQRRGER